MSLAVPGETDAAGPDTRKLDDGEPLCPVETMAGADTDDGGRRVLWWLITEVLLLLGLLLTLVVWSNADYHYSIYAVFAVGVVFAAVVLPAGAVYWLTDEAETEH